MPRASLLRSILPRLSRPLLPVTRTPRFAPSRTPVPSFFLRSLSSSQPAHTPLPNQPQTLSARLKTLIKAYGWYALGVYAIIGVLDFGVAFVAISLLGADHVAHLAASVKAFFLSLVGQTSSTSPDAPEHQTGSHEGTYAMLVLAYIVHKTLFLPRVAITAAVTPRFVGYLSRHGWAGTEGARRAAQEMRERVRRGSRGSQNPSD